jgi:hypothetical protein
MCKCEDDNITSTISLMSKQKDQAYWERNQLVAALSKILPSYLAKHPNEDKDWEDDWRNIVVITMPNEICADLPDIKVDSQFAPYQLTWHIHDHDLPMFDHLQQNQHHFWDGHTTEEKYRRLRQLIRNSNRWLKKT